MKCGELKIDLGCGSNKIGDGFLGVDQSDLGIDKHGKKRVDFIRDLSKHCLPFCDNSCVALNATSFFEHIDDFVGIMNECWRVLRGGGRLVFKVPIAGTTVAYRDPTHRRAFTYQTFEYFFEVNKRYQRHHDEYGIKPWKFIRYQINEGIELEMELEVVKAEAELLKHNCGDLKIDIGCGQAKKEGHIGVDIGNFDGVDVVTDIDKMGLPFCENSATAINAESVMEHFYNFVIVMNECWRVLKPGGSLYIVVPHWASDGAYRDPTHVRFFDPKTFNYFEKGEKQKMYGIKPWKILYMDKTDKPGLTGSIRLSLTPEKNET